MYLYLTHVRYYFESSGGQKKKKKKNNNVVLVIQRCSGLIAAVTL